MSARRPAARRGRHPGSAAGSRRPGKSARQRTTAPRGSTADGPVLEITRRTAVLVTVVVLCLAALVPVINAYVAQQQRLHALQEQVAQQERDVEALEKAVKRWDDPAFVAAQARERLMYAMPGETQYRLTDTSGKAVPQSEQEQAAAEAARGDWHATLWESLEGASRVRPEDVPMPEEEPADGSGTGEDTAR